MKRIAMLLMMAVLLGCGAARADTCLTFEADPDTYSSAGSWTVLTTFVNCGDGYLGTGGGFGTDTDPYATDQLLEPSILLAPGESASMAFSSYEWTQDVPENYTWEASISVAYVFFEAPCDWISVPCTVLGSGTAWTSFTATNGLPPEAPEPMAWLMLITGGMGIILKKNMPTRAEHPRPPSWDTHEDGDDRGLQVRGRAEFGTRPN
jgi:hypothetical protein